MAKEARQHARPQQTMLPSQAAARRQGLLGGCVALTAVLMGTLYYTEWYFGHAFVASSSQSRATILAVNTASTPTSTTASMSAATAAADLLRDA